MMYVNIQNSNTSPGAQILGGDSRIIKVTILLPYAPAARDAPAADKVHTPHALPGGHTRLPSMLPSQIRAAS